MRVDVILSVMLALAFWRFAHVAARPRSARDNEIDGSSVSPAWLEAYHRGLLDAAETAAQAPTEPASLTIGLQPGTAIHLVTHRERKAG